MSVKQLSFFSLKNKLLLVPDGDDSGKDVLVFTRKDHNINLEPKSHHVPVSEPHKKKTVFGFLGTFSMPEHIRKVEGGGLYLLLITRRVLVGTPRADLTVWRIEAVEIVHVNEGQADPSRLHPEAAHILKCLNTALSVPYFYTSYDGDLSHSAQRSFMNKGHVGAPMETCDKRFIWNYAYLTDTVDRVSASPSIHRFLVTIIMGAILTNKCSINGKEFTYSIISRRSRFRTGTRFNVRGCDEKGHVANFVETEQLVEDCASRNVASFVQTRGSMPMFWQQDPNMRYMPKPTLKDGYDHLAGYLAHFREQATLYGQQVIVNLIDHKKNEGALETFLKNLVAQAGLSGVNYVAFDFHRECSKMRYENLSKLMTTLKDFIAEYRFFFLPGDENNVDSIHRQAGAIRTNCMDCLDRTNVVQSLVATEILKSVLLRMNILHRGDDILKQDKFQSMFRNAWADHADLIAVQYAGTGALKTDFTRVGRRTYFGHLQDGWNAAIRYVLNNLCDGHKTDSLRLMAGETNASSYLTARRQGPRRRRRSLRARS